MITGLSIIFELLYREANLKNDKKKDEEKIMKSRMKKIAAIFAVTAMTMGCLAGCGNTAATEVPAAEEAKEDAPAAEATADLSGTISMAGSTSMEKLANALSESFMAKYPSVTMTAEFTGSSAGIESLTAGSVDIGNSSRNLKDEEKLAGAVENIVAIDGIAIVTDKENKATDLTKDQLCDVYTGKIKNWKDLGGDDQAIVVVGREAGSGTRGAFEEILDVKDACAYANELDSTGAVMAKVASTPGAIGYVSLDIVDDTVAAMKLDGTDATEENIKAGKYLLSRPFVMATMGEISDQSEAVQGMFDYLASDEGKELIKGVGLITVD